MTKKKVLEELQAWSLLSALMICIGLGTICPVLIYKDWIIKMNEYRFWTEATFWGSLSPFFVLAIGGLICFIYSWIITSRVEKYKE